MRRPTPPGRRGSLASTRATSARSRAWATHSCLAFMNAKRLFPDILKAEYALGASIGCGDGLNDGQSEPLETLATLLRAASPRLRGASHGGLHTSRDLATDYFWEHKRDLMFHCGDAKHEAQCGFNVAAAGAVFNDSTTPSILEQVSPLAERLRRADPPIEGWTVVTLEAGVLRARGRKRHPRPRASLRSDATRAAGAHVRQRRRPSRERPRDWRARLGSPEGCARWYTLDGCAGEQSRLEGGGWLDTRGQQRQ